MMRWFVDAVALAVKMDGCPATGGFGLMLEIVAVGTPPSATTAIDCCATAEMPPASVTVSVTTNVPGVVNWCLTIWPDAKPSPPKFHVKLHALHGCPSSVTPEDEQLDGGQDPSNVTTSPTTGVVTHGLTPLQVTVNGVAANCGAALFSGSARIETTRGRLLAASDPTGVARTVMSPNEFATGAVTVNVA